MDLPLIRRLKAIHLVLMLHSDNFLILLKKNVNYTDIGDMNIKKQFFIILVRIK